MDVLSELEEIKVCTDYNIDGKETQQIPYDLSSIESTVQKDFVSWGKKINLIRDYTELPNECKEYVNFIEKYVGVDVNIISVGPDREETIIRY